MDLVLFAGACAVIVCVFMMLTSLFLKTCQACRLRMPRRATKCPWCHTFAAASHAEKKECL